MMVRLIQVADDGTETASVEVDDFTMEVLYSGLAEMLRDAAARPPASAPACELSPDARHRRQRVLSRLRD
jgi:hypothetical protein